MKIKIEEAKDIATQVLIMHGFEKEVAEGCVRNIIEGELVGKKTHGLIRILHQIDRKDKGTISTTAKDFEIHDQTNQHLYVNSNRLPGFYAIYKTLDISIPAAKKNKLFVVGIKDTDITGYIGDYARIAAENDLIYIGFHNSPGGLVPHGAKSDAPWGTDPVTFGIPNNSYPAIFDSASSKITWGDLMFARKGDGKLQEGVAVDENGEIATDANKAVGLLPAARHKGSGLAFVVEMLAGVLTGSGVGEKITGGWGSYYILIDPTLFRPINEFKKDVEIAINELKSLPKATGVDEIYYPGEQSARLREGNIKAGELEVDDKIWTELRDLVD
jgi:LDH2 family malate/lactate/ureidoglycolate dehydrogenase